MRLRRFVPTAVVVYLSANALNFAQVVDSPPRFTSAVELVSLNITVTDQSRQCLTGSPVYWTAGWDGCPVSDLGETAFRITEDGVDQTITLFYRAEVPIAMSVVIDVRSSDEGRMTAVHEAAKGLTRKLRANDSAVVMPSTPDMLSTVLERHGSPLSRPVSPIRRDAVVYVTDGQTALGPNVLLLARRSFAAVYVIVLMGDQPLDESREPAVSLRRLANTTGGRAFFPADARRLPAAYNQMYEELSRQYTVGYLSTNSMRDGEWRNVVVHVDRPNTSARTRQGYFAPLP